MEMLLMGVCLSVFGMAVVCIAFAAATRRQEEQTQAPAVELELAKQDAITRFFVTPTAQVPMPPAERPRVPIEALLLQLEDHVRLEHAAAESYLASPTAALLHSRTSSRLVN